MQQKNIQDSARHESMKQRAGSGAERGGSVRVQREAVRFGPCGSKVMMYSLLHLEESTSQHRTSARARGVIRSFLHSIASRAVQHEREGVTCLSQQLP